MCEKINEYHQLERQKFELEEKIFELYEQNCFKLADLLQVKVDLIKKRLEWLKLTKKLWTK